MTELDHPPATTYRITVSGHLGHELRAVFEDLTVLDEDGSTVLVGPLDQAALFGVLTRIRVHSLRLLTIRRSAA